MKNLKMFAIAVMAFAVMAMGVHATSQASFSKGLESVEGTFESVIGDATQYSVGNDNKAVEVTIDGDISETLSADVHIRGNIVLNLDEYTLTLNGTHRIIVDSGATLTLKGVEGKATLENDTSATGTLIRLEGEKAHLTIEKGVYVHNKSTTNTVGAVLVEVAGSGNSAKETTVTIAGKVVSDGGNAVSVSGNIKLAKTASAPVVTIADDAEIESKLGTGYYQAGYAVTTIGAAKITGKTGVGVKAGSLVFNKTNVFGTGTYLACSSSTENDNGITDTGAAVVIEGNATYKSPAKVTFNGGSYTSDNANAVMVCGYDVEPLSKDSKISGNATFESGDDVDGETLAGIAIFFDDDSIDEEKRTEYINDLKGLISNAEFNGPVVSVKIGANGKMDTDKVAEILTNGASTGTDDEGNTTIGGNTDDNQGTTEPGNTGDGNQGGTDNVKNPETNDNILVYAGLGLVSLASVAFTTRKRED